MHNIVESVCTECSTAKFAVLCCKWSQVALSVGSGVAPTVSIPTLLVLRFVLPTLWNILWIFALPLYKIIFKYLYCPGYKISYKYLTVYIKNYHFIWQLNEHGSQQTPCLVMIRRSKGEGESSIGILFLTWDPVSSFDFSSFSSQCLWARDHAL